MSAVQASPADPPARDEHLASVWLTRPEVATRLRLTSATLANWAWEGKGPRFAKFGRHVRYRLADVIAWENEQMRATA